MLLMFSLEIIRWNIWNMKVNKNPENKAANVHKQIKINVKAWVSLLLSENLFDSIYEWNKLKSIPSKTFVTTHCKHFKLKLNFYCCHSRKRSSKKRVQDHGLNEALRSNIETQFLRVSHELSFIIHVPLLKLLSLVIRILEMFFSSRSPSKELFPLSVAK